MLSASADRQRQSLIQIRKSMSMCACFDTIPQRDRPTDRQTDYISMPTCHICSHTQYASEITELFLVESYCLSLISYGCEALNLNSYQMHQCAGIMRTGGFFLLQQLGVG